MGADKRPARSSKAKAMERVSMQQRSDDEEPDPDETSRFVRTSRRRKGRLTRMHIPSSEEEEEPITQGIDDQAGDPIDSNEPSAFAEYDDAPPPSNTHEENSHEDSDEDFDIHDNEPLADVYLKGENPTLAAGTVITKSGRLSKPPHISPIVSPRTRPRRASTIPIVEVPMTREQRLERRHRRQMEANENYEYANDAEEIRTRSRGRKRVSYAMDDIADDIVDDDDITTKGDDDHGGSPQRQNFSRMTRSRGVKPEDHELRQNRRAGLRARSAGNQGDAGGAALEEKDTALNPANGVTISPRRTRNQRRYAAAYKNSDGEAEGDGDFPSPASGEESEEMEERGFEEQEVLDSGPPIDESESEVIVRQSRRQTRQRSSRKPQPQRSIRMKRKRRPTRSTRQENSVARETRKSYRPRKVPMRPTDFYPDVESSSDDGFSSAGEGPAAKRSRPTRAAASRAGDAIAKKLAPIDYLENPMGTADVGRPVRAPHPGRYSRRRNRLRATGNDPFASDGDDTFGPGGHPGGIEPIQVDLNTSWDDVGGLDHHVRALKEMVSLPLLYPEVFEKFNMEAPKGVLFYGPPGTGKTLCARALAASCGAAPEPEEQKIGEASVKTVIEAKATSNENAGQGGEQPTCSQLPKATAPTVPETDVVMKDVVAQGAESVRASGNPERSNAPDPQGQSVEDEEIGSHTIAKEHENVITKRANDVQGQLELKESEKAPQKPEGSKSADTTQKSDKPQAKRKPRVSFFMRNGADCLSKWVGEAERQLRMTFEAARKHQPAIIFFDEIDGLAPVRSSRQDQIHSSIVSTLLGLMDGLDARGKIVVIGATNRVDAIDPALRRPGRFDRELIFTLPNARARRKILDIHTSKWQPRPSTDILDAVANMTVGYCGADLKSLCSETALRALRRRYPQIYNSTDKLLINIDEVKVTTRDFLAAMREIVPASHRSARTFSRPLSARLQPVLKPTLDEAIGILKETFPEGLANSCKTGLQSSSEVGQGASDPSGKQVAVDVEYSSDEDEDNPVNFDQAQSKMSNAGRLRPGFGATGFGSNHQTLRPRLLLCGVQGLGQAELGPAILHNCEACPVHAIDFPSLHADVGARSAEEALTSAFREALRSVPSILYLPHLQLWWESAPQSLRTTLLIALKDLPADLPLLVLATAETHVSNLPSELIDHFGEVLELNAPSEQIRQKMFEPLLHEAQAVPKLSDAAARKRRLQRQMEVLPKAPPPAPKPPSAADLNQKVQNEDRYIRRLRMEMRAFVETLLRDSRFKAFWNPVDPTSAPDYYDIIKIPMDISKIAAQVDLGKYPTVLAMVNDFDIMVRNAIQYNPPNTETGALILRRAHGLIDIVHAWVDNLNPTLVETCNKIIAERVARAQKELERKEAAAKSSIAAAGNGDEKLISQSGVDIAKSVPTGNVDVPQPSFSELAHTQNTAPDPNNARRDLGVNGCVSKMDTSESRRTAPGDGCETDEGDEEPVIVAKRNEVDALLKLLLDVSTGLSIDGLEGLYVRCARVLHEDRRTMNRAHVVQKLKETVTQARDDPTVVGKLVA